jgi:uncharacterized membrane protein YcgQ (UPF0703/DUF1980 family)
MEACMSEYVYEEKENYAGKKIKVLGPTYEEGKPDNMVDSTSLLV